MMANIKKIAFVTGANRGLGYETARDLGLAGVHVLLGSRDLEAGEQAVAKLAELNIQAEAIKFDLLREEDHIAVHDYLEKNYGRLDILVNNAAFTLEGNASELGLSRAEQNWATVADHTFTPPQNTAPAAFCGLFLLWRSYQDR
jgi:NAD(P)-dependent dehydrogenase (short-subunit alcohol dehydrogenase family)